MGISISNHSAAARQTDNSYVPTSNNQLQGNQTAGGTSVKAAVTYINPDNALKSDIRNRFAAKFGKLASNKKSFHDFTRKVFGNNYNSGGAEKMRQAAAKGDYSWLPEMKFVSRDTLQGANGAYAKKENKIYLAGDLRNDPALAANTFTEEAGHHIDAGINSKDTPGDEGEMFRRVLNGEKLSQSQVNAIRNENDHGVLNIDGKKVEVEFFFKKLKKKFKSFTKKVTRPFRSVAKGVGRIFKKVTSGVGNVFKKVSNGVGGIFKKMAGTVGKLFKKVISFPKRIFQTVTGLAGKLLSLPKAILGKVFRGIRSLVSKLSSLPKAILGNVFEGIRSLVSKALSLPKAILGNVFNVAKGLAGKLFNLPGTIFSRAFNFISNPLKSAFGLLQNGLGGMSGLAGKLFNPVANISRFATGLFGRIF